jgi:hypothetical protein
VLALAAASPAMAQSDFVRPEALDSASAQMRDSYVLVRDTLRQVNAGSALLQRDVRIGSEAVLISRARMLESSCSASLRQLDLARREMLASKLAPRAPAPRRTALDKSLTDLRSVLLTCVSEYQKLGTRAQAPEIRGRGIAQSRTNQQAVRNFESAADAYLLSLGIKVRPFGAGENPLAGTSRVN